MQSLRGVTLPDQRVLELLRGSFVVGTENIEKRRHVGMSHGYRCNQTAVGTTNGAGGRNVQILVLAPDRTVLHVLPGFWHPDDLVRELGLASDLHRLWLDPKADRAGKERMFAALHRVFVRGIDATTRARSAWQSFDEQQELSRYRGEPRDTVELDADGVPRVKPICILVHDRMCAQPFRALAEFDMERFVDYGRPYYDNNAGLDKGREFKAAQRANSLRAKEQAKAEAAASNRPRR